MSRPCADAQNYAGQDEVRVKTVDLLGEAQKLLSQADQAIQAGKKQMDKGLRKQLKK